MKGCELFFAGIVILELLAPKVELRCPSNDGTTRDCSFTTCSASKCAAQGLECGPKRCGGSRRVKGVGGRESPAPRAPRAAVCPGSSPPEGGRRSSPSRITCANVHCSRGPCCMDACGRPHCRKGPS